MSDPNACATVKRRVRALALVNELVLSRHDANSVDSGELFRSLAQRIAENSYPATPAVLVQVQSSAELDPQSAGLASQCLDRAKASPLLSNAAPEVEIAIITRDMEKDPGLIITIQAS